LKIGKLEFEEKDRRFEYWR